VFFHNPNDDGEIRCVPGCADPAYPARSGDDLRGAPAPAGHEDAGIL